MKKAMVFLLIVLILVGIGLSGLSATAAELDTTVSDLDKKDNAETMEVPQIRVTTADGNGTSLQKSDDYVDAELTITDTEGIHLSDSVRFKVRGNSTALPSVIKKAYTFKFDDKVNLLGMGKGKKWALLANAFDPSLLRNYIAFDFANYMELGFTSEQCIVELWLDGSYRGCYTLMEPVEKGKDQVDIDIESNNGMNDFMIEREGSRYESDVTYFKTDGIRFAISEPEEPNVEQTAYIESTMNDIMAAIKSGEQSLIEDKIDVESFARYYLLNELYKTVDFDFSSAFFYYKNGKLYAGPAWDYDIAAGNVNPRYSKLAEKCACTDGLIAANCHLYKYLCTYDWFIEEVRNTYSEYYEYIENITADGGLIDTLLNEYGGVFNRNFTDTDWKADRIWVNLQMTPFTTFEENVEYFRNWVSDRNVWLSDYYGICQDDFLFGDVDGDGDLTILDATAIQLHIARLEIIPEDKLACADADGDGELSIMDATQIQLFIAQLIPEL